VECLVTTTVSLRDGFVRVNKHYGIRFTDAEQALLARKAKAVGRKALMELDTIGSPDALMLWHRHLIGYFLAMQLPESRKHSSSISPSPYGASHWLLVFLAI
jgi:hypothetical protein